jgi:hypothetical protein
MEQIDASRTRWIPGYRHGAVIAIFAATGILLLDTAVGAQTHTVRDTATAYGARLNAKGEPAGLNPNRINSRANNRVETRLSLRIERYRPDSITYPATTYSVQPTDNARIGTETTLSPLSSPTSPGK